MVQTHQHSCEEGSTGAERQICTLSARGFELATFQLQVQRSNHHSTANVCLWRLHGCVLNVIHLSATGVAAIAKSTNLKGCTHTFVYIVYVQYRTMVTRQQDIT